ncbi:GNAT family N-acetyltransferase [Frateuria sp. STR12]|uniref:GNAT family N-acetyltransferase n=1 Tax=Frateuria hangzhouensis TaxID=2995589 RepID=UPI00226103DE|nr:GNAT family N-acetyltransferase [Frateuria sp. STR12]MCX7513427.1 GNAT family N-acetyltransferase [Frateuria sp. STR12]
MPDRPVIHFEPVGPANRDALLELRVHPDQRGYVGAIGDLLADAQACPGCLPLAILEGGTVVGFVRIEADARSVAGRALDPPSLGLRAFFIDARHQRRGLGGRALDALPMMLAARHPHARGIALAVDADNAPALALYRRAGFVPVVGGYHGGPSQPQRLLWRALPDARPPCTTISATFST